MDLLSLGKRRFTSRRCT